MKGEVKVKLAASQRWLSLFSLGLCRACSWRYCCSRVPRRSQRNEPVPVNAPYPKA